MTYPPLAAGDRPSSSEPSPGGRSRTSLEAINDGLIVLRPSPPDTLLAPRTIIVSGVARSGTSMVAAVLSKAGLFLGDRRDTVVFEDVDIQDLLLDGATDRISAFAAARDAVHAVWGFKRPHLHVFAPELIGLFRAPRVVLTFRDPVAVASRNMASEFHSAERSLVEAADDLRGVANYARALRCPTLLVSYEKAIARPQRLVSALLAFTGLAAPSGGVSLIDAVEPERGTYLLHARRRFEGYIDGIEGTVLRGWGRQVGVATPERFTLFADGEPVRDFVADRRRADLTGAGIGDYAFEIDIGELRLTPATTLVVRPVDRLIELINSRRSVAELRTPGAP